MVYRARAGASGACGLPQLVLSAGAARFSVSQNTSSVIAWAEGGRQLLVGAGALGGCDGELVVVASCGCGSCSDT